MLHVHTFVLVILACSFSGHLSFYLAWLCSLYQDYGCWRRVYRKAHYQKINHCSWLSLQKQC